MASLPSDTLRCEYDALIAEALRTNGKAPVNERGLRCILEHHAKVKATFPRLRRFDKTQLLQQMKPPAGGVYRDFSADAGVGAHGNAIHVVVQVEDANNPLGIQEVCVGPLDFNPYYVA